MKISPLTKLKQEFRGLTVLNLLGVFEKSLMAAKGMGNTRELVRACLSSGAILVTAKQEEAEALIERNPGLKAMGVHQFSSYPQSLALFDNGAIILLLRSSQQLAAKGTQVVDWLDYKRID